MTKSTMLDPDKPHLAHENICLLELKSSKELEKVVSEPSIRSIVWTRLDDTRVLVDSTRVHALIERLEELNISCRFRDSLISEDA